MISLLDTIIEAGNGNTLMSDCTTKQKRQVRENSYSNVIRQHVQSLNVAKEEQHRYYSVVHTIMAEAGIIDSQKTADANEKDKRYKPFDNSPYGEFVDYERVEGGRKRVNSYLLNEVGMSRAKEILETHVTDRCLTKGTIQSAQGFRDELKAKMGIEFLKSYLVHQGIDFDDKRKDRIVFRAPSVENGTHTIPYTCYLNNSTKVQYATADGKKSYTSVFWLIHSLEVPVLCNDAQEKAIRASRIFREYWNLQFNGKTEWGVKPEPKTSTEPVQSSSSAQSVNADELVAEVKALRGTVEQLTSMMTAIMKHLNCDVPVIDVSTTTTSDNKKGKDGDKATILNKIMALAQPLAEQKRYKTISRDEITKEKKPERKKLLQDAYDYLDNRRLLTAKYKPQDGWKFDFKRKSIELLYRIDTRKSAVYNTRHRPLTPQVMDGKVLKEVATAGEKYTLPYGLEKLDYSYKTIFVTEGIFDSCFLKNCLAYSNWTCPTGMNKVVQMFRDHGYQIIHILDNFQEGDKGGRRGLDTMVRSHDWLQQGDRVFDWTPFTGCKDLNDVAMKYELDEIDPQTIIANSWNEDEVLNYYNETVPSVDEIEEAVSSITSNQDVSTSCQCSDTLTTSTVSKESIYIDDDEMSDFMAELEAEQQELKSEQERRRDEYQQLQEQESEDWDTLFDELYNPKSFIYQTPGITILAPHA